MPFSTFILKITPDLKREINWNIQQITHLLNKIKDQKQLVCTRHKLLFVCKKNRAF